MGTTIVHVISTDHMSYIYRGSLEMKGNDIVLHYMYVRTFGPHSPQHYMYSIHPGACTTEAFHESTVG